MGGIDGKKNEDTVKIMRIVVNILKLFLPVLLCANLFFWMAAHGSGHKIPAETNWYFAFTSLALTILLIIVFFLRKKILHTRNSKK